MVVQSDCEQCGDEVVSLTYLTGSSRCGVSLEAEIAVNSSTYKGLVCVRSVQMSSLVEYLMERDLFFLASSSVMSAK